MKILNNCKRLALFIMALGLVSSLGSKNAYAVATNIESGIYSIENDVYHESETGIAMSRTYLQPSMEVEVRRDKIAYTIGFSGSEYMENYRMKLNGEEVSVELIEDNSDDGTVKLKITVDKVDADMDAMIYVAPMERDVEFKVIPKIETLTLVQAIEEPEEKVEKESNLAEENVDNKESNVENEFSNRTIIIVALGVLAIGLLVIGMKVKKK